MKPRLATVTCPQCKEVGTLCKILCGMPLADFDFEKYAVGGFVMNEDPAEIAYRECDWEGKRP